MKPGFKPAIVILAAILATFVMPTQASEMASQETISEDAPAAKLMGKEFAVVVGDDIPVHAGAAPAENGMHSCVFKAPTAVAKTARTDPAHRSLVLMLSRIEANSGNSEPAGSKATFGFTVRGGAAELGAVTCETLSQPSGPTAGDVVSSLTPWMAIDSATSKVVLKTSDVHEIAIENPLRQSHPSNR